MRGSKPAGFSGTVKFEIVVWCPFMRRTPKMSLLLLLSLQAATALLLPTAARLRSAPAVASPRQAQMGLDRRSALGVLAALPVAFVSTSPAVAATDKVVIFGGSGYVGAHAAQMLLGQGAEVVSVSRKSAADQVACTPYPTLTAAARTPSLPLPLPPACRCPYLRRTRSRRSSVLASSSTTSRSMQAPPI